MTKRNIQYIVVHCTATQPEATIESIKNYWKEHLGWSAPGYHYIIERDGTIVNLLPEEQISNGVLGFNTSCINIAYIGGIDRQGKPIDNRSEAQTESLFNKIVELTESYPNAIVQGHRDFPNQNRACPYFDVKKWMREYIPPVAQAA
jgi:N-acetylmuramoyl-L-alanine amidase